MKTIISLTILFAVLVNSCSTDNSKYSVKQEYFTSGCLAKKYYVNGQMQKSGTYEEYYEKCNILKLSCNYLNNEKEGEQREYYDNGELKTIGYYKNSKLDSIARWYYQNGKVRGEFFRLNGSLFGIQKEYYETGELKYLYFMKNDSEQLFAFDFNEQGKIIAQSNKLLYGIYEKDTLLTIDTAKLVFYTIVPPNYKISLKIVEKQKNKYYHSEVAEFDTINNNDGVLILKNFTNTGKYEIGAVVHYDSKNFNSSFSDSLFISIVIR